MSLILRSERAHKLKHFLTKSHCSIQGFWIDYPNIEALLKQLNISESTIFTPFTTSSFYSPFGLEATAPVFSNSSLPQLPSPLGQVLATFQLFERIPIEDRASIIGLLYAIIDLDKNEKTFSEYDRMTAHDLFIRMGISKRLVDDFIRPTLLVGLFKPPEELSAAVVMELLYYYALAHQSSFDVRWLKRGSIANVFFNPLYTYLSNNYDFTLMDSTRVDSVNLQPEMGHNSDRLVNELSYSTYKKSSEGSIGMGQGAGQGVVEKGVLSGLDGVVLALGSKGLKSVMAGSPELSYTSPQLTKAASMGSIDCISCRIWLNKKLRTGSPSNVLSRFDALRGAGGTFFMLDQLHKDHLSELWGETEVRNSSLIASGVEERGSVIAVDFYNAGMYMAHIPCMSSIVFSILYPSCAYICFLRIYMCI